MRLQSISLHHYGVQVPFKTASRLVFAKKSGGFQSGIPDENWRKVTFTIEWLGFRGWQDGGCIWGQIFSGSVESLADDKLKFGGGTVGHFGGSSNEVEWPKMIKFICNSMNSQLSWPELFPMPAKNSFRWTTLLTLVKKHLRVLVFDDWLAHLKSQFFFRDECLLLWDSWTYADFIFLMQ